MNENRYEKPTVEDRTPVSEPLNATSSISDSREVTPAWRRKAETDE